jgi:hypothetical protein
MKLNVLKRFVLVVVVPGIGTTCEVSRNTGSTKMHGSTVVLFIHPSSHWGEKDQISLDSKFPRHIMARKMSSKLLYTYKYGRPSPPSTGILERHDPHFENGRHQDCDVYSSTYPLDSSAILHLHRFDLAHGKPSCSPNTSG